MKKYRIYKYFDDCDETIYGTYDSEEKAKEKYNELCRNNRTIYTSYRLKEIEVPDNIKENQNKKKQMNYKEKDIQKAKELVNSKPFSTSQSPLFKEWAYDIAVQMAEYKDKEFEDLINGLPTPIKELIKAFKNN